MHRQNRKHAIRIEKMTRYRPRIQQPTFPGFVGVRDVLRPAGRCRLGSGEDRQVFAGGVCSLVFGGAAPAKTVPDAA